MSDAGKPSTPAARIGAAVAGLRPSQLRAARPTPPPKVEQESSGWGRALVQMLVVTAVLWIVQVVNAVDHHHLDRFGLRPRTLPGLEGVLTMPFLHASVGHLLSNTGPFVILGWVVMLTGVRTWAAVTGLIMVVGGLATWVVAPSGVIVGASALIMGWLGYLLARAWFARKVLWIVAALMVVLLFGGLFSNLLPTRSGVSWQAHVCGFLAGVLTAYLLHPRSTKARRRKKADA